MVDPLSRRQSESEMFKTVNPYDVVVAKATDENQTGENWEIFLTVWEKVNEDGEAGARNCVNALQKRLGHRNANVQLFSLSLADSLISNCEAPLHREICGRSFTSALARLVNDRNTHDGVKKRILKLIASWVKEHGKNPDFDLMVETFDSLKAQNHKFDDDRPATPTGPSDDVLRREEEELQRAIAESAALADPLKGFKRSEPPAASSGRYDYGQRDRERERDGQRKALPQEPASPVEGSFVPPSSSSVIRDPAPRTYPQDSQQPDSQPEPTSRPSTSAAGHKPSRVRALYDFETQTPEELPLKKGDVVKVISCTWAAWWLGELRGRQGIFPTSYVEEIPDPPPTTAAQEAEMEVQLFAQSASIDNLLNMMRSIDPASEDLAQNEELLELYQQSMALRPRVVKLLDKYNKKQMELRAIHDKFDHAKSTYEKILAESQTRYNPEPVYQIQPQQWGGYPGQQHGAAPAQHQGQAQMDPNLLASMSEQDRVAYQQRWAEYELQMQQYNAQQAAAAQYYAQQQQVGAQPGPESHRPPAHVQSPPHDPQQYYSAQVQAQAHAQAEAQSRAPQPQAAVDPNAPVWDHQRGEWLYPNAQPPHGTEPITDPRLQPAEHAYPDPNAVPHPSQAPHPSQSPSHRQQAPSTTSHQLVDQMEALSMAPGSQPLPVSSPPNVGGYAVPSHVSSPPPAQIRPTSAQAYPTAAHPVQQYPAAAAAPAPQPDQAEIAAQWAAYHAAQAAYAAQNPELAAGGPPPEQYAQQYAAVPGR